MKFYLGTHRPHWLALETLAGVPLFIQRGPLAKYKKLPRAVTSWALDSGGFTEIGKHGHWRSGAREYAAFIRRARDEIGLMEWAAPQDWMCEPDMLKKTGLTVAEHQRRTIDNFLELRSIAPDLPIIPVLQGWQPSDYLDHIDAYAAAGVELAKESHVGLGTVCRRQHTVAGMRVVHAVVNGVPGIRLHGFGFKMQGLALLGDHLDSADSMAWSLNARRNRKGEDCGKKNCANCLHAALEWRERLDDQIAAARPRPSSMELFA